MKGRALRGASADSANMCSAAQLACTMGLVSAAAFSTFTARASQAMKPSTKSFKAAALAVSCKVTGLPRLSVVRVCVEDGMGHC